MICLHKFCMVLLQFGLQANTEDRKHMLQGQWDKHLSSHRSSAVGGLIWGLKKPVQKIMWEGAWMWVTSQGHPDIWMSSLSLKELKKRDGGRDAEVALTHKHPQVPVVVLTVYRQLHAHAHSQQVSQANTQQHLSPVSSPQPQGRPRGVSAELAQPI